MFVRAANPIWYFVDLVGNQLDDRYFAFFLQNTFPYLPQPIYQTPGGTFWSDPIQFLPNGTLPDNLYFDPTKVYRIEIRKGNTQADPLIYEINNFIPGSGGTPPPPTDIVLSADNQVTNPQFAFVDFINPLTIAAAGTYDIAPGWFLKLMGTGTATITKINTIAGNQGIINNPPYALEFNLSGWSSAILYQQFNMNGSIWASTPTQPGAVTMSITAQSNDGVAREITLQYVPSTGATEVITTQPLNVNGYSVIDGAITLPLSTNSDISDNAFVQMQILLPPTGVTDITNIQVIGEDTPIALPFQQETIERQEDQLFHVYRDSIILQPKDDILSGWNFGLNPWQFTTTTLTAAATQVAYYPDQTILVQQAGNSVQIGQAPVAQNKGLKVLANATTNNIAIIQYIDPSTIAPYWLNILSSLAKVTFFTNASSTVKLKMRLIWRTTLPSTISSSEPIASWSGTDPVFSAGWTAITPLNDPAYTLVNNVGLGEWSEFPFNGFVLPASSAATMTLGIVLYTVGNMTSTGTPDYIVFDKVSLVPNEFAIETSPLTFDESLRRCQFYYESSYPIGSLPGAVTASSQILKLQPPTFDSGSSTFIVYPSAFDLQYKTIKRAQPSTINFYSPTASTLSRVIVDLYVSGSVVGSPIIQASTNWTQLNVGTKSAQYVPATAMALRQSGVTTSDAAASGDIRFQTTIDARLGV